MGVCVYVYVCMYVYMHIWTMYDAAIEGGNERKKKINERVITNGEGH